MLFQFLAQAEPAMTDQQSWTAWATAIGIVIAAVSSAIGAFFALRWTKGSKAIIAEKKADAALVEANLLLEQARQSAKELDFSKAEHHYRELLKEAGQNYKSMLEEANDHYESLLEQAKAMSMQKYVSIKQDALEKYNQLKVESTEAIGRLQQHVDILDKKLDACETRHLECVAEANFLRGKIEMLETVTTETCNKVHQLEEEVKHDT